MFRELMVHEGDLHGVGELPLTVFHELLLHEPVDSCVEIPPK
jgi:hypothetical protein